MKPPSISPARSSLVCDFLVPRIQAAYLHTPPRHRYQSSLTSTSPEVSSAITNGSSIASNTEGNGFKKSSISPLSALPTPILLRTLMITTILSSPRLLNVCLPIMDKLSRTKSWIFNPDRNPALHRLIRLFFYDHFCAGENAPEISKTISTMKSIGFKGVILGYGREIVAEELEHAEENTATATEGQLSVEEQAIEDWKDGNLTTLSMLGTDDFLAIKFTGAGPLATHALLNNLPPPERLRSAIRDIALQAKKQSTRFWIDAEQDCYQAAIDAWTLGLMREFNASTSGDQPPLIYTTMQAYLLSTPTRIAHLLNQSTAESWNLGIKLVRGAYIASEPNRNIIIHPTKAETDKAYNAIAEGLLTGKFWDVESFDSQNVSLMLASHNEASVLKAWGIYQEQLREGKKTVRRLEFAQLQGMADDVSCRLVVQSSPELLKTKNAEEKTLLAGAGEEKADPKGLTPRAYKCLCWGSVQECMQFLVRRAVENRGAVERIGTLGVGLRQEVWRRVRRG